ncbi:hypothetical protein ACFWM7_23670 [Streptomyces sp. NPDC058375]|uniref:hypothetical protein n=1 Tax=Streptomyces sp. NPDC058375 TaxID=3346467 RepID=UPI0036508C90
MRLLRSLAGLQLLSETEPGVLRPTAAGDFLRTGMADSMAAMARMFTDPVMLRGWDLLDESVRTGETTFDTVSGSDFFGRLKEHPAMSAAFNEAMSPGHPADRRAAGSGPWRTSPPCARRAASPSGA